MRTDTFTLRLSKWIGLAKAEKLTTDEVMEELRGRPFPWQGNKEDLAIFAMPQKKAVATLKKRRQNRGHCEVTAKTPH